MSKLQKSLIAALLVLVLGGAVAAWAEVSEHFDQTYAINPDGRISLDNVNGDVQIEVWDRDEVWVQAEKTASTPERLDELRIEVASRADSLSIETRYPQSRHGHRNTGRTEVTYKLTVPRMCRLDSISLVNGNADVVGVMGGVNVDSVNGEITAREVAGDLGLETVNGAIHLYADRFEPSQEVDLESVNGHLHFHMSPATSASLDAETVNGRIRNDFGLEVNKHKYVGADLRGDIGSGGTEISAETVNGGISFHND